MDPKEIHDHEQIAAAMRALAHQTAVFHRALLDEEMPAHEAMFLAGEMLSTLMTMGMQGRDDA